MKVITIVAAAVAASVSSARPVSRPGDKVRIPHVDDTVVLARSPSPNPRFYSNKYKQAWRLDLSDCRGGNRSDVLASDMLRITPVRVSPDARDVKGVYDELTELTQLEGTSTWLYMPGEPLSRPGLSKRGGETDKPTISPRGMPDRSRMSHWFDVGGFVKLLKKLHLYREKPNKPTLPPHGMPDRSRMSHWFDVGGFVKLLKKLHIYREKPNIPTIPPHGMPDRSHMSHRFDAKPPTIPPHGMPDRSHMSHRFDAVPPMIHPHGMPDRSHMSYRVDAKPPTIPPHGMPDRSHMSHRSDEGGWFVEPSKKLHLPRQQWDNMIELRRKNGGDVSSMFARRSNSPEAPGLATSSVDTASLAPRIEPIKKCLECTGTLCFMAPCQSSPANVVDELEKRAHEEKVKKQ